MQITRHNSKGMTLVEIMVALVIVFILLTAAMPNFYEWIQNSRIRTAAESIQNGLALARTEAVHRNTTAQFVSCGRSSWDVIVASSVAASSTVCAASVGAGWISIQSRSAEEVSPTDLVDLSQTAIGFNGLGKQVSVTNPYDGITTPGTPGTVDINVSASGVSATNCLCSSGTCGYPAGISYATDGKLRCLRITVTPGGQVRMCNPALSGPPQGC